MAIFAIGLAVAAPSLMQIGRRNSIKRNARIIKDVLYNARMKAVELNEEIDVQIDPNTESYTTSVVSNNQVLDSFVFSNADIGININPSTIRWNTRGQTSNACTITVQSGNYQYNVVVNVTGNVRIVLP